MTKQVVKAVNLLDKKKVEHISRLAKLSLSPDEKNKFQRQLSDIIGYISHLDEVNTSNLQPTSQTTGLEDVFRKDETKPDYLLDQETALSSTDKVHNGYFVVNAVLQNKDL